MQQLIQNQYLEMGDAKMIWLRLWVWALQVGIKARAHKSWKDSEKIVVKE